MQPDPIDKTEITTKGKTYICTIRVWGKQYQYLFMEKGRHFPPPFTKEFDTYKEAKKEYIKGVMILLNLDKKK